MTEEQIKQNAYDYTYTNDHNWTWDDSGESRVDISEEISDAYLAGAHSRDDEVTNLERLNYQINQQYDEKVIENAVLSDRIEDLEFQLKKVNKEYVLMKSAYKVLEYKLNKLDPEWMTK